MLLVLSPPKVQWPSALWECVWVCSFCQSFRLLSMQGDLWPGQLFPSVQGGGRVLSCWRIYFLPSAPTCCRTHSLSGLMMPQQPDSSVSGSHSGSFGWPWLWFLCHSAVAPAPPSPNPDLASCCVAPGRQAGSCQMQ